eukprot:CAMPEP_0114613880 /NCGR_PEP_ID=MMETSP0168-20121206/5363_1 /TAXON_ID=95228 ORGANISM="Vannella sp., Strain DIVA3 517/6/12" /NCGR_SAMPLE_ID=MMETSP0168 /ASSEMBLY_ACC=CAM_ASM_000044 /LENGTH=182 /DNA_ID=CAMNT_0001824905 /DNA_START=27 /DNA_END=575 /DNA_ORIENTATION=-
MEEFVMTDGMEGVCFGVAVVLLVANVQAMQSYYLIPASAEDGKGKKEKDEKEGKLTKEEEQELKERMPYTDRSVLMILPFMMLSLGSLVAEVDLRCSAAFFLSFSLLQVLRSLCFRSVFRAKYGDRPSSTDRIDAVASSRSVSAFDIATALVIAVMFLYLGLTIWTDGGGVGSWRWAGWVRK